MALARSWFIDATPAPLEATSLLAVSELFDGFHTQPHCRLHPPSPTPHTTQKQQGFGGLRQTPAIQGQDADA